MSTKKGLAACIFRIHSTDGIRITTLSLDAYSALFKSVDESLASRMFFQTPKELKISADVMSLARKLIGVLSIKKAVKCHALILEMLDKEADVDIYDDLCEAIELALRDKKAVKPWCIGIAVSNCETFMESQLLMHRLIPECKKSNTGLILLSDDQKVSPRILFQGTLPSKLKLPPLQPTKTDGGTQERVSDEQIAMEFDTLFGHFEIETNGINYHLPAVASVKRLAKNTAFVKQLRYDVTQMIGGSTFSILPFGIPLGGMNVLSLGLVEGNAKRLCNLSQIKKHDGSPILILCDFLSTIYPIEKAIHEVRERGIKQIAIAAIARYQDFPEIAGIPLQVYLDTNYSSVTDKSRCNFCRQDVPAIVGEHFEDFARKIKQFDSFTFWEFISRSGEFLSVGHWPSDRTPNHYHFRIVTKPIFKRYCYDVSLRLRNILESKSIVPKWVKKIICTEGEESTSLSIGLSEVLGLSQEDVIQIPRKFLASIAGKQINPELLKDINSTYGEETLRRQNVLIVDQAAHHFKTMSSLRDVCKSYDCTVLAFAVFIDRTDIAFSLGEYLHDSHYINLYSWPVPPRRAYECPCIKN